MPTTLIVVRHGNTFRKDQTPLRIGAGTDIPLTEEGMRQASRVGKYLCRHAILPAVIVSSPLIRTMQTAFQIRDELDANIPVETAEFLREIHYGPDDGIPETEVLARIGKRLAGQGVEDAETHVEMGKQAVERWNRELIPPPGWEIDAEEKFRQWRAFGEEILEKYPEKTVLAVTSNGIARFVWGILTSAEAKDAGKDKKLATGAFSVFRHTAAGWACEMWNFRPETE